MTLRVWPSWDHRWEFYVPPFVHLWQMRYTPQTWGHSLMPRVLRFEVDITAASHCIERWVIAIRHGQVYTFTTPRKMLMISFKYIRGYYRIFQVVDNYWEWQGMRWNCCICANFLINYLI
jgi:hypothetical protein